ncbi:MAG: hypothetical protein LBF15_02800, partial [Candidatus Peribacteria bacterium]|nr:hypothetical protein [Candidatus Peribacteria bacterium]
MKSLTFSSFIKIAHDFTASLASLLLFAKPEFTIVSKRFSHLYLNPHIALTKVSISSELKSFATSTLSASHPNIKCEIVSQRYASFSQCNISTTLNANNVCHTLLSGNSICSFTILSISSVSIKVSILI